MLLLVGSCFSEGGWETTLDQQSVCVRRGKGGPFVAGDTQGSDTYAVAKQKSQIKCLKWSILEMEFY